MYTYIQKIRA